MHGNDSSYAPTYMYIVPQHTMRLEDNPIMHVHCVRIFTRELVVGLSFWLDFRPLLREDARCFFILVIFFLQLHVIMVVLCKMCGQYV